MDRPRSFSPPRISHTSPFKDEDDIAGTAVKQIVTHVSKLIGFFSASSPTLGHQPNSTEQTNPTDDPLESNKNPPPSILVSGPSLEVNRPILQQAPTIHIDESPRLKHNPASLPSSTPSPSSSAPGSTFVLTRQISSVSAKSKSSVGKLDAPTFSTKLMGPSSAVPVTSVDVASRHSVSVSRHSKNQAESPYQYHAHLPSTRNIAAEGDSTEGGTLQHRGQHGKPSSGSLGSIPSLIASRFPLSSSTFSPRSRKMSQIQLHASHTSLDSSLAFSPSLTNSSLGSSFGAGGGFDVGFTSIPGYPLLGEGEGDSRSVRTVGSSTMGGGRRKNVGRVIRKLTQGEVLSKDYWMADETATAVSLT